MYVPCLYYFYKLSRVITSKYTYICVTCCMTFFFFNVFNIPVFIFWALPYLVYFGLCPTLYIFGLCPISHIWAVPYLTHFGLCPISHFLGCALSHTVWAVPYLTRFGLCPISHILGCALSHISWAVPYLTHYIFIAEICMENKIWYLDLSSDLSTPTAPNLVTEIVFDKVWYAAGSNLTPKFISYNAVYIMS